MNSSFYASSFFITLFTQVMQSQTNSDNMWKLKRIWDYFIVVSFLLRSFTCCSMGGKQSTRSQLSCSKRMKRIYLRCHLKSCLAKSLICPSDSLLKKGRRRRKHLRSSISKWSKWKCRLFCSRGWRKNSKRATDKSLIDRGESCVSLIWQSNIVNHLPRNEVSRQVMLCFKS